MRMKQVADRLGKHENTIRNWAEWYGEFLSVAPPKGEARFFTDDDLRVLAYVSELSGKGLSRQAIQESLREKFDSNVPFAPVRPDALLDPDVQRENALALAESRAALVEARTTLALRDAHINELSATVNELREQVQYLRTTQEQERSEFTARLNELMERYMDRYIAQADRVGDKYSGEVARLREEIGQLRQQVQDAAQDDTAHQDEVERLNRIIEDLSRRLERINQDKSTDR